VTRRIKWGDPPRGDGPTGTGTMNELKALLLTDVVDSTKLSEKLGDAAMAEVWAAHDRAARDLLPAWRGREIDKTDGMLMLFDSAADAVNYAREYHRALAALPVPLKARAGLHVGPVILRENSAEDVARGAKPLEVDGVAKPTAARVMSLARGGQILLTEEARAALGDTALRLESHGHWMMKGLADPVELFEACDAGTAASAPADSDKVYRVVRVGERWLPVAKLPNNLPQQATSFIGRERELDEVKALLSQARLITLLGMGGLGKTRLSLQVAAEVMPQYPDGAWFIDLTPIREAERVLDEAARVLDVTEEPGRPLLATLCASLKAKRLLIILDNCEHLIEPAAELVAAILRAAPNVRVLASSRESLRVPGEQAYPILPLPLPDRGAGAETLSKSTAVRLFVERAQSHRPAFALTEKEAPAVAELVARLEGIPLALELAAARVRLLSVADINARLTDRFKLLAGGDRTLQKRQQTLQALVDWSYDLLNDNEKCVLGRLGVFVGGFDMAAAEAVCGADPVDALEVLDLVGSLVEKSLVMTEEREDATRYRMLETIREYALEKLVGRGEESETAVRHCQYYFDFAKKGRDGIRGAEQPSWVRRFEDDRENLRAATALALAGSVDPFIAVKMALALAQFWILRGYVTEGRGVVRAALALPSVQSSEVARAWSLYVGAALAGNQGDHAEARTMLEACLELRRRLDNQAEIAGTLSTLSHYRLHAGDPIAAEQGEREALQLFRQLGNRVGEAICLAHLGRIALYRGDVAAARAALGEALAISRDAVQREVELMLGESAFEAGDLAQAKAHLATSLALCQDHGDRQGEANALHWLGKTDLARGELDAAQQRLAKALRAFEELEMRAELVACLEDHAALALLAARSEQAVQTAGATAQARLRLAVPRWPREEQQWQELLGRLREALPGDAFDAAWRRGEALETKDAVRSVQAAPSLQPASA
jgi:predicted ATPase/class 3 adenylate cyclase